MKSNKKLKVEEESQDDEDTQSENNEKIKEKFDNSWTRK